MKTCFVIMPIRAQGSIEHTQYRALYDTVIRPPLIELGYDVIRADDVTKAGAINADVIQRLASADLVIADLSSLNPNVFYELGIRHALRSHGTILVVNSTDSVIPFDLKSYRVIEFSADLLGYEKLRESLFRFASYVIDGEDPAARDSPVHDVIPSLPSDIFALAEGSTEGKLREQISDLQTRLKRYVEKFGPDHFGANDTASEILARTLELARRGDLPADVFRKAREAARSESTVEYLTSLSQLMDPSAAGSIKVEQWIQLSIDAMSLGLPEVASALNLRAVEQRPNDPTLKSLYYGDLAHSEDPRQREQARTELRTVLGISIEGDSVSISPGRRGSLSSVGLGPMLDAYQRDALHDEALRITTAFMEISPNNCIVLQNHARALDDLGRLSEALNFYKRALGSSDATGNTATWFGNFLHLQDRPEASCAVKARACELDPEDADHYVRLADEIGNVVSTRLAAGESDSSDGGPFSSKVVSQLVVCALSCRQVSPENVDSLRRACEGVEIDTDLIAQLLTARQGVTNAGVSLFDKSRRVSFVRELRQELEVDPLVQEQLGTDFVE